MVSVLNIAAKGEGRVQLVTDEVLQSQVLEIVGPNISENYVRCPSEPSRTLGITLPQIILQVKTVRAPTELNDAWIGSNLWSGICLPLSSLTNTFHSR
jgi:hypothetical protein